MNLSDLCVFFPAVNYGTLLWMNRNLPIVREQRNDRAQKVLQQNWSCHCLFHCCAEHCSLFFTIFGKYMTWNFFHKCFVIAFLSFWRWFAFKNTNKLFPANAFSLIHSCFSFGRINSVSLCGFFFHHAPFEISFNNNLCEVVGNKMWIENCDSANMNGFLIEFLRWVVCWMWKRFVSNVS